MKCIVLILLKFHTEMINILLNVIACIIINYDLIKSCGVVYEPLKQWKHSRDTEYYITMQTYDMPDKMVHDHDDDCK